MKLFAQILITIFLLTSVFSNETELSNENIYGDELPDFNQSLLNFQSQIDAIEISKRNNLWLVKYENYNTYQKFKSELTNLESQLKSVRNNRDKSSIEQTETIEKKIETTTKQLELLDEFKNQPFLELLKTPEIPTAPKINGPISIMSGFSYIKQLQFDMKTYNKQAESLKVLRSVLRDKIKILKNILSIKESDSIKLEYEYLNKFILELDAADDILTTISSVYEKKVESFIRLTKNSIKAQLKNTLYIVGAILFIILLSLVFKFISKRFILNNNKVYIANKSINFISVILIILVLLFSYIENMTYLVTVLGFASAGIAIAMKDMFMSTLGWMVITFGGSFRVGDRVKVKKDGVVYVGDIMDISLMRMTILEEITLTTYTENKRAGRVVFIPNNYIFTTLIANYTHSSLKTVWDGIYLTVSFDSNHKKAMYIIHEITKKYSKGYTEIARKQINHLRQQYNLKNTNIEPRIFSFIEPHGLTINVWFMTNSYATLALRSTISKEIIDAINKEDDIVIAYPTQTLNLRQATKVKNKQEQSLFDNE